MKLFAVVLVFCLTTPSHAFVVDTLLSTANSFKDAVLPPFVNSGINALLSLVGLGGSASSGAFDEPEVDGLLKRAAGDFLHHVWPLATEAEKAEFQKQYEAAKKAGNLKDFLQNYHKNQKAAYDTKKAECEKKLAAEKQKNPQLDEGRFMFECMTPAHVQQKVDECNKKVGEVHRQAAGHGFRLTAQQAKDVHRKCMGLQQQQQPRVDPRLSPEERKQFLQQYAAAQRAGTLHQFLERFHRQQQAKWAAQSAECKRLLAEAQKQDPQLDANQYMAQCMMPEHLKQQQARDQQCRQQVSQAQQKAAAAGGVLSMQETRRLHAECMRASS